MRLGICLPGGGAKGAFQGGVIKRLHENNISADILTGTSIGAINSYFIIKNAYKQLEEFWTNIDNRKYLGKIEKTIDNSKIIDMLSDLSGENKDVKHAFVNYVNIENQTLSEKIVDITYLDKQDALNAVRYSSLLPIRGEEIQKSGEEAIKFDSQKVFQYFKEDVANGVYDDYNLDGGILNNNLLSPFETNKVDKLVIVGLKSDYSVPESIYNYYDKDKIVVIKPDVPANPGDTIRFERDYCLDMYERGYKIAGENIAALK